MYVYVDNMWRSKKTAWEALSTPVHNQIAQKTKLFFDTTSVAKQYVDFTAAIRQPWSMHVCILYGSCFTSVLPFVRLYALWQTKKKKNNNIPLFWFCILIQYCFSCFCSFSDPFNGDIFIHCRLQYRYSLGSEVASWLNKCLNRQ